MPASGKSSNRHYEYGRGWNGSGHGPYAQAGKDDRERWEALKNQPRGVTPPSVETVLE